MRCKLRLAAIGLGVGATSVCGSARPAAAATTVADSAADFSATQGYDGWYYGYLPGPFNPSTFKPMTQFDTAVGGNWFVKEGTYWTRLGPVSQHSNGTTTSGGRTPLDQWSDRRWVSTVAGMVTVSGHVAKDAVGVGGNGVTADVWVDDVEDYSQFIAGTDTAGVNFSLTLPVQVGSTIDFGLDPTASNDIDDTTDFTATIASVPEPASVALLVAPALALLGRRRRGISS